MKSYAKIGLIIIAIGLVIMTIGLVLGGGFEVFNGQETREEKSYTFTGEYSEISIEDRNIPIYIIPSNDDQIHLTTFENENEYYEIRENGTLEISYIDKNNWLEDFVSFGNMYYDNNEYYLQLRVPEDVVLSYDIDTQNGVLRIESINIKDINVDNSNGKIELRNVIVNGNANIDNNNGRILFDEVKGNSIVANNSNGEIVFNTVDADEITADNSNGKIELSDVYANRDINADNSNGAIIFDNVYSDGSIYSDNSNGKIEFNTVSFEDELKIDSNNSKIEVYLVGAEEDYNYKLTSNNGTVSVNGDSKGTEYTGNNGRKDVVIEINNGSINVSTANKK